MKGSIRGAFLLVLVAAVACRGQEPDPGQVLAEVDSLLPRLEVLSGLEARHPIRVERQDRATMRRYVEERFEEEYSPEEFDAFQAAYAAFGLIPDTLDLRALLLDLYTEQVVGYYNPERDALYLVEDAPVRELRPVLVHELVHALQDQHAPLDSLIARERGNDRQTAAQAALEGHATLVMFAWLLEEQAGTPLDPRQVPEVGSQLEPLLEAQNDQFPVFRSAPRIVRETLLFPYISGASFVQALWRDASARSGEAFPAPLGDRLPASTEQVMHPYERFLAERDHPTEIELAEPPADWTVLYENTLGQLETGILLDEHLGGGADALAVGWDGDRFRLLESPDGGRALVWYSVWDDEARADAFAEAYRRILARRPGRHGSVERLVVRGRPVVRIIDAERDLPLDSVPRLDVSGMTEA